MPLLLNKQIDEVSAYAVWNIQETFLELPHMSPEPYPVDLSPVRQAEWIVGRVLAKTLAEKFGLNYQGIGKLETGKPFLMGQHANISISHSFPIASAMIHLTQPCGIDMERPREKLFKVQHKFISPTEKKYATNLRRLCAIWCAKEVVYKIFGRKFLSLKDEIDIVIESENKMVGTITKAEQESTHIIQYEWIKGYLLAYGV